MQLIANIACVMWVLAMWFKQAKHTCYKTLYKTVAMCGKNKCDFSHGFFPYIQNTIKTNKTRNDYF